MTQNMKVSLRGRIELMAHEGIVTSPYKDSVGVWTIGVGVTDAAGAAIKPSRFTGTITVKQAVEMFENVLCEYERGVNRAIKVPLEQHEFDALVSFHYNTGGIARASATKHINAGNKAKGARALLAWKKPPEIIKRREAEVALFLHGKYGDGKANVYPASKSGRVQWGKGKRRDLTHLLKAPDNTPIPKPRPKQPSTVNMLKLGDKGQEVKNLQESLITLECMFPPADGDFGRNTRQGVKTFQHEHNLTIDGIAGPKTLSTIAKALANHVAAEKQAKRDAEAATDKAREAELVANMEAAAKTGLVEKVAAEDRTSSTKLASGAVGLTGAGTVIGKVTEATEQIDNLSMTAESVKSLAWSIGPWVFGGICLMGLGWYIWKERDRYKQMAIEALQK